MVGCPFFQKLNQDFPLVFSVVPFLGLNSLVPESYFVTPKKGTTMETA